MRPFFITATTDTRQNEVRFSSNREFELTIRAKHHGESHKAVIISGHRKGPELFINVEMEGCTETLTFKM